MDHAGDEPPAHALPAQNYTRDRKVRDRSTRASCGSSRWPTRTATTGRSRKASGCGARTCATTTPTANHAGRRRRPQPQLRLQWGYDNEGSSPDPPSDTYRGPGAHSEPENKALEALVKRITPEFFVNYHSAAELLLYGIGWQVATPSPDDVIGETLAGDDDHPAVPGYDPDLSAELYTTNGDTDTHMQENYGLFGFTPEMATCEAAPMGARRRVGGRGLRLGLRVPGRRGARRGRVPAEHPVRAVVAESTDDPDDPESVVGRDAPDFRVERSTSPTATRRPSR